MSAIIGIRCDECGSQRTLDESFGDIHRCRSAREAGWYVEADGDFCPFCAARRKASEQSEIVNERT